MMVYTLNVKQMAGKYHLSKLGEEKYQALKDYYTHDEWETYTSLSIDSCVELF